MFRRSKDSEVTVAHCVRHHYCHDNDNDTYDSLCLVGIGWRPKCLDYRSIRGGESFLLWLLLACLHSFRLLVVDLHFLRIFDGDEYAFGCASGGALWCPFNMLRSGLLEGFRGFLIAFTLKLILLAPRGIVGLPWGFTSRFVGGKHRQEFAKSYTQA